MLCQVGFYLEIKDFHFSRVSITRYRKHKVLKLAVFKKTLHIFEVNFP